MWSLRNAMWENDNYLKKICKLWVSEWHMIFLLGQGKYDITQWWQTFVNCLITNGNEVKFVWNKISTNWKENIMALHTWVSLNRSPVEPLFERRSLPARSIRFRTPCTCWSVLWQKNKLGCIMIHVIVVTMDDWDGWEWRIDIKYSLDYYLKCNIINTSFTPYIRRVNTKWLLDDCSFIWVFPTDLRGKNPNNQYN